MAQMDHKVIDFVTGSPVSDEMSTIKITTQAAFAVKITSDEHMSFLRPVAVLEADI